MSSTVPKETVIKVDKVVNEFGKFPLHSTPLADPESLRASPETVLAMIIDAMIKAKPISHALTQKTLKALVDAGCHDIDTLSNTSWDDRVEVLREGGYNRYRKQCATNLGELAKLVAEKYSKYGDLNNLLEQADGDYIKSGALLREIKGIGDLAVQLFFNNVQSMWPSDAPFIYSRDLATAAEIGIGCDSVEIYHALEEDPVRMNLFTNGLSEVRLEKRQDVIQDV